ncbi:carbohydrate kinase family protein [Catenulispora rubra]|uniref:carbohydrate kinase family protein n=1 Tax=Catenulispora rubra TaxID=280293 RepID=UPI002B27A2FA|nr:carbohydrate kinase family protein [Catenulispora rubra]
MAQDAESASQFDVLVVGGAGIDTIVRVPELPAPYADSVLVPPIESYVAHTGTAVALGVRSLGLRVKFVDFLGEDTFGDLVRRRFADERLDFSWLPSSAGTVRAVNLVSADGRRMSFYDPRGVPGQRMPEGFYEGWLARSRHVHVVIADYARHVLPVALRHGASISTDLHDWDGINDHHKDFAHAADHVFLSAANLGDCRDAVLTEVLARGRARTVVATDGARGAYLAVRGESTQHFPAVTPAGPVVDSNGAGDAFVSGFMSGVLRGATTEECMRRGLLSGAFACTVHGTAERFATESDLS